MKFSAKKILVAAFLTSAISGVANASVETIDWHNTASVKAQQFVKENIALDFYAPPFKTGWDKNIEVANYIDLAVSRHGKMSFQILMCPSFVLP